MLQHTGHTHKVAQLGNVVVTYIPSIIESHIYNKIYIYNTNNIILQSYDLKKKKKKIYINLEVNWKCK